jgi:hypothetical protein
VNLWNIVRVNAHMIACCQLYDDSAFDIIHRYHTVLETEAGADARVCRVTIYPASVAPRVGISTQVCPFTRLRIGRR